MTDTGCRQPAPWTRQASQQNRTPASVARERDPNGRVQAGANDHAIAAGRSGNLVTVALPPRHAEPGDLAAHMRWARRPTDARICLFSEPRDNAPGQQPV